MLYFVSKLTTWPANENYSANLLCADQENKYLPGKYNLVKDTVKDIYLVASKNTDIYNCVYYDKDFNIKKSSYSVGMKFNKKVIYSSFSLKKGIFYSDYYMRTNNFFCLVYPSEIKNFWECFEKLIKLSLKVKKNIKTFYLKLSFFPSQLMKDLDLFYATLIPILDIFKEKDFVIIVDPILIDKLSYFDGLLQNFEEYFKSKIGIIIRISPEIYKVFYQSKNHSFNKSIPTSFMQPNLQSNSKRNDYTVLFYEEIQNLFIEYTQHYKEADIEKLLESHFETITKKYIKTDNYYWTRADRLKNGSRYIQKSYDQKFPSYQAVNAFFDRYFKNTEFELKNKKDKEYIKKRFFKLFQRIPMKINAHISFDPSILNSTSERWTWSKLYKSMCKNNFIENSSKDSYNQIKYLCGKIQDPKDKSKYLIPANNDIMKYFIFQAGMCANLSFSEILRILNEYGFVFVRFALKDLMFEFVIKKIPNETKKNPKLNSMKFNTRDLWMIYKIIKNRIMDDSIKLGLEN